MIRNTLLSGLFLCTGALGAQAATLTFSDSAQISGLDFTDLALSIVAFDPSQGTLDSVSLTLAATLTVTAGLENEGPDAGAFDLILGSSVYVAGQTAPLAGVEATPSTTLSFNLAAFDGATDFGGSSGRTVVGEMIPGLGNNSVTDADTLSALTGTGTLTFLAEGLAQVSGQSAARFGLDPATSFVGETHVALSVTYGFTTPPVAQVPLPASLPLAGLALLTLGLVAHRQRP